MNQKDLEYIITSELHDMKNPLDEVHYNKIMPQLTTPKKKKFIVPFSKEIEEHWVVFDENITDEQTGYLIFYSEKNECFGIGTKSNMEKIPELGTFIGVYGSLLDAINSM